MQLIFMAALLVYLLVSIMTDVTVSIYLNQDCDTTGTEFVLMFLNNIRQGTPLQVSLTTPLYNKEVQVRLTTPVWNSEEGIDKTITVKYGNKIVFDLPESLRVEISGIDYKTVLISADDVIIVYGSNIQKNTGDVFWVYPLDTLGLQYVSMNFKGSLTHPSVAGCIAIQDDTEVNISHAIGLTITNFTSNGHISIDLDQYELFQIQATELTGTLIQSSKPIACFSGTTFARDSPSTSGDHISDQLKPVSRWSSYFVVVANPIYQTESYREFVKIVSWYDNTNVSLTNHTTDITTYVILNPTTVYEFYIEQGDAVTIFSDKVISVGQMTSYSAVVSGMGDQRLVISLGVEEYLDEYTFVFPGENLTEVITTGVFLISKKTTKNTIELDGVVINSTWTNIANSEFSFTWMIIENGFHIVENSNGVFGGYLFGYGKAVQYGTAIGRVKYRQATESRAGDIKNTVFTLVAENYIPAIEPKTTSYTRSRLECLKNCPTSEDCGVVAFKKDVQNECTYYTPEAKCSKMVSSNGYKLYAITN